MISQGIDLKLKAHAIQEVHCTRFATSSIQTRSGLHFSLQNISGDFPKHFTWKPSPSLYNPHFALHNYLPVDFSSFGSSCPLSID
ncbi:hypothetical protein L1887_16918 [Cichorium endivia]|nr:hypothetical protein L1887_16918 [Cichorium endivia]